MNVGATSTVPPASAQSTLQEQPEQLEVTAPLPEMIAVMAYTETGGNGRWTYTKHDGQLQWPPAAQAVIDGVLQEAEQGFKALYNLDRGQYKLYIHVLDGYPKLDYQPHWQNQAGVPEQYGVRALLARLRTASAVMLSGYSALGYNAEGLHAILKETQPKAELSYCVGQEWEILKVPVPELVRVLETQSGPKDLLPILSYLRRGAKMIMPVELYEHYNPERNFEGMSASQMVKQAADMQSLLILRQSHNHQRFQRDSTHPRVPLSLRC